MASLSRAFVWALLLLVLSCRRDDPAALQKRLGQETQLPLSGAVGVSLFAEPDMLVDPVWAAKVELSQSSLARFKASLEAKPASVMRVSSKFSDTLSWWRPRTPLLAREYIEPETSALVTVVVSAEGGHTFAYIEHAVIDL